MDWEALEPVSCLLDVISVRTPSLVSLVAVASPMPLLPPTIAQLVEDSIVGFSLDTAAPQANRMIRFALR